MSLRTSPTPWTQSNGSNPSPITPDHPTWSSLKWKTQTPATTSCVAAMPPVGGPATQTCSGIRLASCSTWRKTSSCRRWLTLPVDSPSSRQWAKMMQQRQASRCSSLILGWASLLFHRISALCAQTSQIRTIMLWMAIWCWETTHPVPSFPTRRFSTPRS